MKPRRGYIGRIGGEHSYNPNVDDQVNWLDRIVIADKRETIKFPTHVTGRMTREEMEAKQAQLEEQRELLEVEKVMVGDLHKLRDDVMAWHDEQLTLAEILERMGDNSLCQWIGVWSKQRGTNNQPIRR